MTQQPRLTLEPLDLDRDAALLHEWVTHPRSVFWQMQGSSLADVEREYRRIEQSPHHQAWLGRADGVPSFLAETYDPAHSELADLPELRDGDLGMHVLVAPPADPATPVHGFTRAVFGAVLDHCFAEPAVRRVVVEPDARNERIRALNRAFGFRELRTITLPTKVAMFSVRERDHLLPENLAVAQRHLVTKAIAEFAHERLLAPVADGDRWLLTTPAGDTTYSFAAELLALDHWAIDASTLTRVVKDEPAAPDVQDFVVEFAEVLGIPDALLPTYLEELAATLASACWKLTHSTATVDDLLTAGYQEIEAAMTEGHPGFVANNGRVGFGADDFAAYAPETGSTVRLHWLAARREHTLLAGDAAVQDVEVLVAAGLDPAGYHLVPVHPWQWRHKIAITFAPDLARRDLVHLGEGPDGYRAQQSIRTFFNTTDPAQPYVKTALSIQNMGFMRGLSPRYMAATPAINDWVHGVVSADPTLQACGFSVLREIASVGYTGDAYHRLGIRSPYTKMIAALWRESPVPSLAEGERLMTMAALLHRDGAGRSFAAALIGASGLDAAGWVRRYLDAYLRPIVHCLLAHDLAFMPHGENLVLVLRDQVPVRAIMKDIGEEVAVMSTSRPLPEEVERVRVDIDQDTRSLALHTDVFDGVLRHLAAILHTDGVLDERVFWAEARDCVQRHADEHPELASAAAAYDLRRAEFRHSCLNRLQLRNTLEMVDLADQSQSLIYAGALDNPIA
ncbi:GNAT family N-acetyltransferase [Nocardioides pyridinolyticus]